MPLKRSYSGSQVFGFDAASYRSALKRPRVSGAPGRTGRKTSGASVVSGFGKARKSSTRGISRRMKTAVLALISNQKEQKMQSTTGYGILAFTNSVAIPPAFLSVCPQITYGTSENQRIGDNVKMTRCMLKVQLEASVGNTNGSENQIVTMWIARLKNDDTPSFAVFQALVSNDGLTQGINSDSSTDFLLPVNDSIWDVKLRKEYKIGYSAANAYGSNDFSAVATDEIDMTNMIKKNLVYNAGGFGAVNQSLFMFFTVYNVVSGATVVSYPSMSYSVVTRYTDA